MNKFSELLESIKKEKDYIDLIETNFLSLAPHLKFQELKTELNDYFTHRKYSPDPKGLILARESISSYYLDKGLKIDRENILITASTSESYSLIFSSLLRGDQHILLPRPGYPLFSYLSEYARITPIYYDLKIQDDVWQIDLKSLEQCLKDEKIKALVLISPNNPTGMMIKKQEIIKIAQLIKDKGIVIILDEVFNEFTYDNNDHKGIIEQLNKLPDPILILNGISKAFASPDLKLGWIALLNKNPAILDKLETANDTYLNCSYLTQALLPKIISLNSKGQGSLKEILIQNRVLLSKMLINNTKIKGVLPQGGIHCVLNFPALAWENEQIALTLLKEYHLAVHPGYFYDFKGQGQEIIISLLNNPEKFKTGLSRLREFSIKYNKSH